jgi:hypothetical protein
MSKTTINKPDENPFLRVLPKRLDAFDFFKKVREIPDFMQKKLPRDLTSRKIVLNQILHDWFHVTSVQFEVYERLIDVISEGYRVRDNAVFQKAIRNTIVWNEKNTKENYRPPNIFNKPVEGFSLIGVSGLGKSYLIEKILEKCFVQTFEHEFTTQIVYLKMNCTSSGSTKSLCHTFLREVDNAIGTRYFESFLSSKYTAEKLIPLMANIAARHHLGVLIIDEINHLASVRGQSQQEVLNFLKNLNAAIGLPIVYVGTPEAFPILCGNFQQSRRSQGIGSVIWDRYKQSDSEWERLLNSLWKNQVLKNPGELTSSIRNSYYELSQGILDPLIKLHVNTQRRALLLGLETIDEPLIREVAKDDSAFTNPVIKALRINDIHVLNQFKDVTLRNIEVTNNFIKQTKEQQLEEVFNNDFTHEEIKMCIQLLLRRHPNLKETDLFNETVSVLKTDKKPKKRMKASDEKKSPLLRTLGGSKLDSESNYSRLKEAGFIKKIDELVFLKA